MMFFQNAFKQRFLRTALASCLVISSTGAILQPAAGNAQQLSPSELSKIREAPFSKIFTVNRAYVVKDKDFDSGNPKIQLFSLWTNIPNRNRLQVSVRYCFPTQDIADSNAYLAEMVLMEDDKPLVTINKSINATTAQLRTVEPGEYVQSLDYPFGGPFYDGFWGPFGWGFNNTETYIPPVDCSAGNSQFDLTPVQDAIARLPNKTLKVKLIFNNGLTQYWHLGKGTVTELKKFPTIRQILANSSAPDPNP